MKKVMILTLALVFALASAAFAEVKVGGELKSIVEYKSVDKTTTDEKDETFEGVSLDTAKLTVTAEEEGVFSAEVTLEEDGGIQLDAYKLAIYDDLFTIQAWGKDAEVASYATPLGFVEAPSDDDTVRLTSSVLGPEVVVDFSGAEPDSELRVFGKYAVTPEFTLGGAAKRGGDREYAVFGTGTLEGVTVSGEYFYNGTTENNKYGVKAETTVSDVALTGKFVRDNDTKYEDDNFTELYFKAAYEPADAIYTGSFAYTTKSFEDEDKFNKLELGGSVVVVPDFVTLNASYLKADDSDKAVAKEPEERYEFTWYDFQDNEFEDDMASKYSKLEVGASVAVSSKLTLEPSIAWETIEDPEKYVTPEDAEDPTYVAVGQEVGKVKVTTLGLDATYAVTDSAKLTYSLTSRTSDEEGEDYNGVFHTLGVSLSF